MQYTSSKSTHIARKSNVIQSDVVNENQNKNSMNSQTNFKKNKLFNQKQLSENQISEKMFRTVKNGLNKTSEGLLSVILIGNKIISSSKKALSNNKTTSNINLNMEDESKKTLVSKKNDLSDIKSEYSIKVDCCDHESSNHKTNDSESESGSHEESTLEDIDDDTECDAGTIGHCHSHDLNFTGMLIHLLGDVVGSLCVIISSIVVVKYNWVYFDTICSIIICIAIIISTIPLNYMIFKKMVNAFSITVKEQKYVLHKISEVSLYPQLTNRSIKKSQDTNWS